MAKGGRDLWLLILALHQRHGAAGGAQLVPRSQGGKGGLWEPPGTSGTPQRQPPLPVLEADFLFLWGFFCLFVWGVEGFDFFFFLLGLFFFPFVIFGFVCSVCLEGFVGIFLLLLFCFAEGFMFRSYCCFWEGDLFCGVCGRF